MSSKLREVLHRIATLKRCFIGDVVWPYNAIQTFTHANTVGKLMYSMHILHSDYFCFKYKRRSYLTNNSNEKQPTGTPFSLIFTMTLKSARSRKGIIKSFAVYCRFGIMYVPCKHRKNVYLIQVRIFCSICSLLSF